MYLFDVGLREPGAGIDVTSPPHPPWFSRAIEATGRLRSSAGAVLGERLGRFFARYAEMSRERGLEASLRGPSTALYVRLVEAYREDAGIAADDARLDALGEGALMLYFYLRMQDDLVDEPALSDRGDVYAMEVLSAASERAFAQALGGEPAFYAFREDVLRAFAGAATYELDVVRKGGPLAQPGESGAVPSWLGRKLLPMAIPLGAMAFLAGRAPDAPRLAAFAVELGAGLQIINDALNAGEDHAGGRVTPVLRALYEGGRASSSDAIPRVQALLVSDPALDAALTEARGQIQKAAEEALSIGARALAAVARDQAGFVDSVPARLLALCISGGGAVAR